MNYSVIYTTGSNNHSQGLPSTNKWFQILAIAWYIARRTCPINNTPKLGSCQLIMKLLHWDGDLFCFDLAPLCARWFVVIWFVIVRMAIVRRSCEWSCDWQSVSPLLPYMLSCCYILDVALNNLNECCYLDSYREHLCFSAKSLVKTSIYPGWQAGIFSRKAQRLPRLFSSNCPQTSLLSIQSGTRTNINQFFMHLALHWIMDLWPKARETYSIHACSTFPLGWPKNLLCLNFFADLFSWWFHCHNIKVSKALDGNF